MSGNSFKQQALQLCLQINVLQGQNLFFEFYLNKVCIFSRIPKKSDKDAAKEANKKAVSGSSLKPAANIKTKEYNNAYGQKQKQKPHFVHQSKSFEGKEILQVASNAN